MKIAFPTCDNETIVARIGNMNTLLVIDVVDGTKVGREERDMTGMPACGDQQNSRPDYVVGVVADCEVVIANGIGAPLVEKMRQAGVDVVLTSSLSIDEALAAYLAGTLENEPELAHAPHH
ncbi:MAG: NifB/NifX family molybdenum-iron cluster-binding protein [Acidimicrobiia bacterium]